MHDLNDEKENETSSARTETPQAPSGLGGRLGFVRGKAWWRYGGMAAKPKKKRRSNGWVHMRNPARNGAAAAISLLWLIWLIWEVWEVWVVLTEMTESE